MRKLILVIFFAFIIPIPMGVEASDVNQKSSVASLGLNPSIIEIVLDKEKENVQTITISNRTNLPIPIKTSKQSFSPKEKINIPEESLKRFDASSWISISSEDTDFILQPQEIKQIELEITQPADASPGGHYATLLFEPLISEGLLSQNSVYIYARVAALIFMQVKGDINEGLQLESLSTPIINDPGIANFSLSLKNLGNTHLRPKSVIEITDVLRQISISKINVQEGIVLPGTTRSFEYGYEFNSLFGIYSIKTVTNYGIRNIALESNTQYFIVIPARFILVTSIGAGFTYLLVFKMKNRLKRAVKALTSKDIDQNL